MSRVINKIIITLLLCLSLAVDAWQNDSSHFLTRLSPDEGLSQSYVTKTVQDKDGYLWIGTQMGLNRYDGYNIKQISGPNGEFQSSYISTLYIDDENYLWVSTVFSGLYRMNPETMEVTHLLDGKLNAEDDFISETIAIEQQSSDSFWLGISNTLFNYTPSNGQLTEIFKLDTKDDIVRALRLQDQQLFVATSKGLYTYDLNNQGITTVTHLPVNLEPNENNLNTKSLNFVEGLGFLVGTVEGLYSIDLSGLNTPKELVSKLNIWDIQLFGEDILLGTDQGLFLFKNGKTRPLIKFSKSKYLTSDNNVLNVLIDNSNAVWLASKSGGVYKWTPGTMRFNHIGNRRPYYLSSENVWGMHQDKQGDLWVGSDNGLNQINFKSKTNKKFNYSPEQSGILPINHIFGVFPDSESENQLWLFTYEGLKKFDKLTGMLSDGKMDGEAKEQLTAPWIGGVYVNNNQNIFFFNSNGHFKYNAVTGRVKPLEALNEVLDTDLSYYFMGTFGKPHTTLLSVSGHLYFYDSKKDVLNLVYKVKNYQPQSFTSIESWKLDNKNTLWLALSGEGLVGLDKYTYKEKYRFDKTNALTTNHVYSLMLDRNRYLWFSSQSGLYQADLNTMHIKRYGAIDGLLSTEFNSYSNTKLKNGLFVYGSPSGLTTFNPKKFTSEFDHSQQDYKVRLTDAHLISNREKKFDLDNISLNHDDFGLTLSFSTLWHNKIDDTLYNITLDGNSKAQWINQKQNSILLPNLPAGKHILNISATNPASGEISPPLRIQINALHAPWATPLAKAVLILITLSLFAYYAYSRNKRNYMLRKAHLIAESSKKRMELALKGSKSGIWELDLIKGQFYQERLCAELGYDSDNTTTFEQHMSLINDQHKNLVFNAFDDFISGKTDVWDVTYQLKKAKGGFSWYRDYGRIIERDKNGKPTKAAGTYINVTQTKAIENKAELFGDAFSQINDWVLILDSTKQPVSANEAFLKAFHLGNKVRIHLLKKLLEKLAADKYDKFEQIITELSPGETWQGEEYLATKTTPSHPVLVKINAIVGKFGEISNYVIVISDITAQKEAEEKLRHIAHYDFLTDLPNRKLIFEKIKKRIGQQAPPFALLFIDLDKFKQVNDLYGHSEGDKLLKMVGDILTNKSGPKDMVARQSGDEFIVYINQFTSIDSLSHFAQEIIDEISAKVTVIGQYVNITCSVGVATYPEDSKNPEKLIRKADLAMLHAKQAGKNQFQFFTSEMNEKAHRRIQLEKDLQRACREKEFHNHYQAIVSVEQTQSVVGCELLLRWRNRDKVVSPFEFIPLVEELGLISSITLNAIEQALIDYPMLAQDNDDFYISVNLSPIHILQEGLASALLSMLAKYQLSPKVIRLEITESILLADINTAILRLEELQQCGFELLLDDFGTGYSSLTYVSKFPINYLKIDRSFVSKMDEPANFAIIQSILSLAKNIGLPCVAEGVETKEQLQRLTFMGCHLIQGYYFAKPVPCEAFDRDLEGN